MKGGRTLQTHFAGAEPASVFARWWRVGLTVVVGFLATVVAASLVRRSDLERQSRAFERRTEEIVLDLRAGYEVPLEVVLSLPPIFSAGTHVDQRTWEALVRPAVARHPSIAFLEWAPWLPDAQRASFESAARAEGLTEFAVNEPGPDGQMRRAAQREGYWPVLYVEPRSNVAIGLDIGYEESRRATFLPAIDSGQAVASSRFSLAEDPPTVMSMAIFAPVYEPGAHPTDEKARRGSFRGFVIGVFRLREATLRALEHANLDDTELALVDESATPSERLLFETRQGLWNDLARTPLGAVTRRFDVAQRHWAAVLVPKRGAIRPGAATYSTLGLGLLLTFVAASFVGSTGAVRRLQRELREARKLGQYHLVRKIGEGGMGAVYEAQHALLRRPTAVKLLSAGPNREAMLARFEREVRVTARLANPHTIAIYDFGRAPKGIFYCAMEYLHGVNLDDLVREDGPQPESRVIALLVQVCESLAEAHAEGLVHRDVKPANLMVCVRGGLFDFVKVLDFGLVKEQTAPSELSRVGEVLGTPLYMAPESVNDATTVGPAADIYALGAVAYWLLTASDVFAGEQVVQLLLQHLTAAPESLSTRAARPIHPGLEALVLRCLAKDPADRPASARALATELAALDVPRWTEHDAEQWWRERGFALLDKLAKRAKSGSSERTLQVALDSERQTRTPRAPRVR